MNTPISRRRTLARALARALAIGLIAGAAASAMARDVFNLQGAEARTALTELQATLKKAPTDFEANKDAGIVLHQLSRQKPDKAMVEQGERYLKQASVAKPDDPETKAWLGSITTMKALFETDPGRQTLYVKLGARAMDSAVVAAPDNLVVRLVRANNSLELPPFLKRSRFAVEDYGHVLQLCSRQACPPEEVTAAKKNLQTAKQLTAESL